MSKRSKSINAKAYPNSRTVNLRKGPVMDLLRRLRPAPDGPPSDRKLLPPKGGKPAEPPTPVLFNRAVGVCTDETVFALMNQLLTTAGSVTSETTPEEIHGRFLQLYAQLAELRPQSATEAMVGTRMIGTQMIAMEFLRRLSLPNQTPEQLDANLLRASRLLRLCDGQTELMAKLQGKSGQQRVVVEHVTVNEGGQAIVGTVTPRPGGVAGGDPVTRP